MKISEIFEQATAGATSAGNIATVANPHIANNALDMNVSIFGAPVKR